MQRGSHVEILLVVGNNVRIGRLVDRIPLTLHDSLILRISCRLGRLFDCRGHLHLSLEVHLGLLVALLPILELLVPPVNEVVARCDMVVPVVLDALLGVLPVKGELINDLVEQLLFNRHLLFAWKQTHVTISVFDEQRPRMVSDVIDSIPLLGICVQDPSYDVFALAREELWQRVFRSHDLFVQV